MAQASFISAHLRYNLFFFFFLPKLKDMTQIFLCHTFF